MTKIKKLLALALLAGALLPASAAGSDVVVLMDASGTILPYFDEINNRILVDITRKFVRQGDTFHLVSFNSRVNLEIVQPIRTEADVSRVVSRFMLLYPLGQNSDFLSGIHYTWQYVSSLDHLRDKIIIIISDGIFNPPAASPYYSWTGEQVRSDLSLVSGKIRAAGWKVYYIKLPFPQDAEIRTLDGNLLSEAGTAASGNGDGTATGTAEGSRGETKTYSDISGDFTGSLDIEPSPLPADDVPITFVDSMFSMPEVTFPQDLGKKGRIFTLPLKIKNTSDKPLDMELDAVFVGSTDVLDKNAFLNLSPLARGTIQAEIRLPPAIAKGPQDIEFRLQFSGNLRVTPQSGVVHLTLSNFSPEMLFRTGGSVFLVLILVVLAVVLVAFLFFFIAHRTTRPASDAVRSAELLAAREKRPAEVSKGQPLGTGKPAAAMAAAPAPSTGTGTTKTPAYTATASAAAMTAATTTEGAAKAVPASATAAASSTAAAGSAPVPAGTGRAKGSLFGGASLFGRGSKDTLSAFETEKKRLPSASDVAAAPDKALFSGVLAAEQAAEKSERLSVLATAAKKSAHHTLLQSAADAHETIAVRENTRIMLELHVDNQNPNVGKRNIHMMKAGTRLSLGGGSSPFLVFLVRFPPKIAEIRYDGKECSLAILKPDYFPYEESNIIHDCVNRKVTVVSDKAYELTFEMRVYEDPVQKLNRLLTSIKY